MKTLLAVIVITTPLSVSVSALAQSAMPAQTTIASAMLHQTPVRHTSVLSRVPRQSVIPQTAMPGDRGDYTSMPHYPIPVPASHESQQYL
jgi:hypothetical protein